MFHNTKSWPSFFLLSLSLSFGRAELPCVGSWHVSYRLFRSSVSGEYEQMALECSHRLPWMFSGISKLVLLRPKKHKENWMKAKLRFVAIMQFLEVPWNGPWALWEGYCGSAMQVTTLNSTKLPGSTTDLWELQTAFTASLSTQLDITFLWLHHTRKQSISTQLQPWYIYQYQCFPRLSPHVNWL